MKRPQISPDTVALIKRMAAENRLWGRNASAAGCASAASAAASARCNAICVRRGCRIHGDVGKRGRPFDPRQRRHMRRAVRPRRGGEPHRGVTHSHADAACECGPRTLPRQRPARVPRSPPHPTPTTVVSAATPTALGVTASATTRRSAPIWWTWPCGRRCGRSSPTPRVCGRSTSGVCTIRGRRRTGPTS